MHATKYTYAPPDTQFLPSSSHHDMGYHGLGFGMASAKQGATHGVAEDLPTPSPLPRGGWVWGSSPGESAPSVPDPLADRTPAEPPQGWAPQRSRILALITNDGTGKGPVTQDEDKQTPDASGVKSRSLLSGNRPTASVRASLLGEAPAPGPAPKLEHYLSQSSSATTMKVQEASPVGQSSAAPAGSSAGHPISVPPVSSVPSKPQAEAVTFPEAAAARSALAGFVPFGSPGDEDNARSKRSRYLTYLRVACDPTQLPEGALTITSWAKQQGQSVDTAQVELKEFLAASRIFRPLSSALAGRFATSSGPVSISAVGLDAGTTSADHPDDTHGRSSSDTSHLDTHAGQEDVPGHANRHFGPGSGTRTTLRWLPERLLSKRFSSSYPPPGLDPTNMKPGVIPTFGAFGDRSSGGLDVQSAPASAQTWIKNQKGLQELVDSRAWEEHAPARDSAIPSSGSQSRRSQEPSTRGNNSNVPTTGPSSVVGQVGFAEDQRQIREVSHKPPAELLKSVFGDSSDEEGDTQSLNETETRLTKQNSGDKLTVPNDNRLPMISSESTPIAGSSAIQFIAKQDRRAHPLKSGGGTTVSSSALLPELGSSENALVDALNGPTWNNPKGTTATSSTSQATKVSKKKKDKKSKAKRGLLSFGQDEEQEETTDGVDVNDSRARAPTSDKAHTSTRTKTKTKSQAGSETTATTTPVLPAGMESTPSMPRIARPIQTFKVESGLATSSSSAPHAFSGPSTQALPPEGSAPDAYIPRGRKARRPQAADLFD